MREKEDMYAEERKKRIHPSRVCINFEEFKDHPPHLKLSVHLKLRPYLGTPKEELPILEVRSGSSRQRDFDRLLETMTFLLGSCLLQAFTSNTSETLACFLF